MKDVGKGRKEFSGGPPTETYNQALFTIASISDLQNGAISVQDFGNDFLKELFSVLSGSEFEILVRDEVNVSPLIIGRIWILKITETN